MDENREPSDGVVNLLTTGRKIDAIKLVRQEQQLGLKDARDFVEAYVLRHPNRFPALEKTSSSARPIIYAALVAAVYIVYRFTSQGG